MHRAGARGVMAALATSGLLLSGCALDPRAAAMFFPPSMPYSQPAIDAQYGYSPMRAPGSVWYPGGYWGGAYYRPGYYVSHAPFVAVQPTPDAYALPASAYPRVAPVTVPAYSPYSSNPARGVAPAAVPVPGNGGAVAVPVAAPVARPVP